MDASSTKNRSGWPLQKMTLIPLCLEQNQKAIRITRINFLKRKTSENGIKGAQLTLPLAILTDHGQASTNSSINKPNPYYNYYR
jgi:hypothetical protein